MEGQAAGTLGQKKKGAGSASHQANNYRTGHGLTDITCSNTADVLDLVIGNSVAINMARSTVQAQLLDSINWCVVEGNCRHHCRNVRSAQGRVAQGFGLGGSKAGGLNPGARKKKRWL